MKRMRMIKFDINMRGLVILTSLNWVVSPKVVTKSHKIDRTHNPNQLLHFQIKVCGKPYDKNGIHITDPVSYISIPKLHKGTIIFAGSHAPSDQKLQTCCHLAVTPPSNWMPSTISLGQVISENFNQDIFDLQAACEFANRENLIKSLQIVTL
jgi:hypothetical protein